MWNLLGLGRVFSGNRKSIFALRPKNPKREENPQREPTKSAVENVPTELNSKPSLTAKVNQPVVSGRKRSLEEFRTVFGHIEGTVLFVDGLSFEAAAQTAISKLNQTIAQQLEVMEDLEATIAGLSTMVCDNDDSDAPNDSLESEQERYVTNLAAKIRALKTERL